MSDQSSIQQAANTLRSSMKRASPSILWRKILSPRALKTPTLCRPPSLKLLEASQGAVGGFKIASTNPASRQRTGVSGPCASGVFARQIASAPATFNSVNYSQFCIECEVGVRLASDLPAAGAPYTRSSVADAIESLSVSFELIDRREAASGDGAFAPDIKSILTMANAGALTGATITIGVTWTWRPLAAS